MGQFRLSNAAALAIFVSGVGVVVSTLQSFGADDMTVGQVWSLVIGLALVAYATLSAALNAGRRARVLRRLDGLIEKAADESWDYPTHDARRASDFATETYKYLSGRIGKAEADQRFAKPVRKPDLYEALWHDKSNGVHKFLDNVVMVLREIRDAIRDGKLEPKSGLWSRRS